jgi:hypothetical protein
MRECAARVMKRKRNQKTVVVALVVVAMAAAAMVAAMVVVVWEVSSNPVVFFCHLTVIAYVCMKVCIDLQYIVRGLEELFKCPSMGVAASAAATAVALVVVVMLAAVVLEVSRFPFFVLLLSDGNG